MSTNVGRGIAAVFAGAVLAGSCISLEPQEETARDRARSDALAVVQATQGRQLLEASLANGDEVLTLHFRGGMRAVARDFTLLPDRYCHTALARHGGGARHTDHWTNYGAYTPPLPRRCGGYDAIARVSRGDARH